MGNTKECRPFIESSCLFTNREKEDPFSSFHIADSSFLDEIPERSSCPRCNKSRKYYCYTCYVAVDEIKQRIPFVKLPIKIDIVKHPKEVEGKSTSAHAAVLAPNDVQVFTYPNFPTYDLEKTLLIFPSKSSVPFHDWWNIKVQQTFCCDSHFSDQPGNAYKKHVCCCDKNSTDQLSELFTSCNHNSGKRKLLQKCFPFEQVVFIDSTWKQAKQIYHHPAIKELPCVVLTKHKSLFWRHQRGKPEFHLATIEAIYYFLVELHNLMYPGCSYCGRYDNLLFFFKFMYFKIRTLYDPATLKAYNSETARK